MTYLKVAAGCIVALGTLTTPIAVQADEASQLTYINGMSAGDAERELGNRGFNYVSSNTNSMGYTYSYWWDEGDDDCVQIEAYRGTIETINDASDQDCGHHEGSAGAAVAAVAGAAILGALLSHRGNHHDDNSHNNDANYERDFDRGYNDGLHNASYHNSGNSQGYSAGYSSGVDERTANLRHHTGRGGYHPAVNFSDLQGARAAGAMDDIERRGFRQVDNFTSGNTRYSIQWNSETRQCVQMTIADGHIYDIRDIGSNPHCH